MSIINSRKGFELAISTLVVMVLGVLIIGGGIVLLTKLTASSIGTVGQLTQNQQNELNRLMTEGQLVATSSSSQDVLAGQTATIGLGIENKLDQDTTFEIAVVVKDKEGNTPPGDWKVNHLPTLTLKKNEQKTAIITVTPPRTALQETYTFLVTVKAQGETEPYDSVRFFTIRVQ